MIGRTNTGGGGGGLKDTDALLRVQAPAGSVVTITKGATTKTDLGHENADDHTVYDYYFIIHQSQFDSTAWTVSASDGTNTVSKTIVINAADEYDVVLDYYPTGDLIPTMTSATTPSGVVSASSNVSGNSPYYAFDGDPSTKWYANSSADRTERYLQYEFADDVKINSVEITLYNFATQNSTTQTVTVYTSTDGTTFTSQYSESVTLAKSATVTKTYPIDSGVCRYIRFGFSDMSASSGYYPSFMVASAQASYN